MSCAFGAVAGIIDVEARGQWIANPTNGHTYRLSEELYYGLSHTFGNPNQPDIFDAVAEAAEYGGNLVTINDAAESAWLAENFAGSHYWIGLTDSGSEGTWYWFSGEPVTYTNWASGEPNNLREEGEDSAVMNWNGAGQWNDLGNINHDDQPLPAIIEVGTVRGDMNCDGVVDAFDIDGFVLAITAAAPDYSAYYSQYPDCERMNADVNQDGLVNVFDIDPFVACIVNQGCA
jgi:hypothetical protein